MAREASDQELRFRAGFASVVSVAADQGRSPVYLVHFTQNACADTARDLLSTNFCTKEEKHAIARALKVA